MKSIVVVANFFEAVPDKSHDRFSVGGGNKSGPETCCAVAELAALAISASSFAVITHNFQFRYQRLICIFHYARSLRIVAKPFINESDKFAPTPNNRAHEISNCFPVAMNLVIFANET